MLSVSVLSKTASEAFDYYLKQEDLPFTFDEANGTWWGEGAKVLGIAGKAITPSMFESLYQGRLPDGKQLGRETAAGIKHRPGADLTFSAPKSFSILMGLTQDKRLIAARDKALSVVLTLIEKECAMARKCTAGMTTFERTEKLVIARVPHLTSRALDPQDHVHCLVMNMTQRQDGQWRALASQLGIVDTTADGTIEKILARKKYYGLIYRHELARQLQKLGFEIERKNRVYWEIKGVPQVLIDHFSTRRLEEILPYLAAHGLSGGKASQIANKVTRKEKQHIDVALLIKSWWQETDELQCDASINTLKAILENPEKQTANKTAVIKIAKQAITFAIEELSETRSVFSELDLINQAMIHAEGILTLNEVEVALQQAITAQELLPVKHPKTPAWTTPEIIAQEKSLIQQIQLPVSKKIAPLSNPKNTEKVLKRSPTMTAAQRTLFKALANNRDRWVALGGRSGTGKTWLTEKVIQLAEREGMGVLRLVPSQKMLEALIPESSVAVKTVWQYLFHLDEYLTYCKNKSPKPLLLVIEGAEQLGTKTLNRLLSVGEKIHARGILVHNPYTRQGQEAGAPLTLMKQHGMTHWLLTQPYRITDARHHAALSAAEKQDLAPLFDQLLPNVVIERNTEARQQRLINDYLAQPLSLRAQTLILATSKTQAQQISERVRQGLKTSGQLASTGIKTMVLHPRSLGVAKAKQAKYYAVNQWVGFNHSGVLPGVQRSTYAKITYIDSINNVVTAKTTHGRVIAWQPDKLSVHHTSVYEEAQREFAVGDKIFLLKTHPLTQFPAHRIGIIKRIKKNTLTVQSYDKQYTLNTDKMPLKHVEHGYAISQQTAHFPDNQQLLCDFPSYLPQTHQRQLYRLLAASAQAQLYTNDVTALQQALEKNTGCKLNALPQLETSSQEPTAHPSTQPEVKQSPAEKKVKDAWEYATGHLTEREAGFMDTALADAFLNFGLGQVSFAAFQAAIKAKLKAGSLLTGKDFKQSHTFTTAGMRCLEEDIIRTAINAPNSKPLLAKAEVDWAAIAHQQGLVPEQTRALQEMLTSTRPVRGLQGFPGTGKTTLMRAVKATLEKFHTKDNKAAIKLLGLAPTHTATQELAKHGLPAQTVDSFLVEIDADKNRLSPHTLVLIDEISMVPNEKLWLLQHYLLKANAHINYIGDERQLTAINAGHPFYLLLKAGLEASYLGEIKRQKVPLLQKAVHEVAREQFSAAFASLVKQFIVHKKKALRLGYMANYFLQHTAQEREKILIITPANEDRQALNKLIWQGLRAEGTLKGPALTTWHLIPENFTFAQTCFVGDYQPNMVLRFTRFIPSIKVARHSFAEVLDIHEKKGLLKLKIMGSKQVVIWHPEEAKTHLESTQPSSLNGKVESTKRPWVEVYRKAPITLCKGDKLRWTRTDKARGRLGTAESVVTHIDYQQQKATVRLPNEALHHLDFNNPLDWHFTYAYCGTTYTAQGKSGFDKVIALQESFRRNLANQRDFWVTLSRAVKEIIIVTDNKGKLLEQINRSTGDKYSALDILAEGPKKVDVRTKEQQHLTLSQTAVTKHPVNSTLKCDDASKRVDTQPKKVIEKEMER